MTVMELTRQLGAALQREPEYIRLMDAKQKNDEDSVLQEDIGNLNLIRIQYNVEYSKEEDRDAKKIEEYNNQFKALYAKIMRNPNMTEYNAAKEAVDKKMDEITTILTMCINGEDPETCEIPHSSCTGSCASCGGCH